MRAGGREDILIAMTPPPQGARRALGLLALLLAWVPWLGASLALLGLLWGGRGGRPGGLLGFALALGIAFTLAFHFLPKGSLRPADPRLELLEERFQPGGNFGEIDPLP